MSVALGKGIGKPPPSPIHSAVDEGIRPCIGTGVIVLPPAGGYRNYNGGTKLLMKKDAFSAALRIPLISDLENSTTCASRCMKRYVIVASFAVTKTKKPSKCPTIEEWEFSDGGVSLPGRAP